MATGAKTAGQSRLLQIFSSDATARNKKVLRESAERKHTGVTRTVKEARSTCFVQWSVHIVTGWVLCDARKFAETSRLALSGISDSQDVCMFALQGSTAFLLIVQSTSRRLWM